MSKRILVTSVKNHIDWIFWFFSRIFLRLGGVILPTNVLLTVNGIWGWKHPLLRSQKLKKVWIRNLYQILISIRRHKSKSNFFDITGTVCKLQTKILRNPNLEMQLLGMLTSQNFAELSLLTLSWGGGILCTLAGWGGAKLP